MSNSNKTYAKLLDCYESFKETLDLDAIGFKPKVALVLGSGLGEYADKIDVTATLGYSSIDGFPTATVEGHRGRFVFGYIGEVPVVAMQGRVHYYEGYSMDDVVLPIRLMRLMGAEIIVLTSASGAVDFEYTPGDFMLIRDQISSFVPSPLIGANLPLGERFPDMSKIYDPDLCAGIKTVAKDEGILLREGVYLQLSGPNYETPAEIRMARAIGANVVGMSTACEAIAAKHAGFRVCGISCISNLASGMTDRPLSHNDVAEVTENRSAEFERLITATVVAVADEKKYIFTEEELMYPHID